MASDAKGARGARGARDSMLIGVNQEAKRSQFSYKLSSIRSSHALHYLNVSGRVHPDLSKANTLSLYLRTK